MIVASFATHVHRVQQMIDSAHRHGRKVAFVGRSMVRNMHIARISAPHVPRRPARRRSTMRRCCRTTSVLLISTGSQGEPLSALSRMSRGEHRQSTSRPGTR